MLLTSAKQILIEGIKDYQTNGARIDDILARVNIDKNHSNILLMADFIADSPADEQSIESTADAILNLT